MSSFIIPKCEYIKAAGILRGMENKKQHPHEYFINNVRTDLARIYELNVKSYNLQYECDEPIDVAGYDDLFESYEKIGERLCDGRHNDLRQCTKKNLFKFFQSVLYQIEDKECEYDACRFIVICLEKLYSDELDEVQGWWGSVDIYK